MARIPVHLIDPHPPLPPHKRRRRRRGPGPLLAVAATCLLGLLALSDLAGAQSAAPEARAEPRPAAAVPPVDPVDL
jgi:hypothetical protein